jgi:hypothetical protein
LDPGLEHDVDAASLTISQLQNFESLADRMNLLLQLCDLAKANQLASDLMIANAQQRLMNLRQTGSFALPTLANPAFGAGEVRCRRMPIMALLFL